MNYAVPADDDGPRVRHAPSGNSGDGPAGVDPSELRAAIERELDEAAGTTAAQARFLRELGELPAAAQRELLEIATLFDDADEALMPAIAVLAPGQEASYGMIAESFRQDEQLQAQWKFAYETLRRL